MDIKATILTKGQAAKALGVTTRGLNKIKIRYDLGKYSGSVKGNPHHQQECLIWYERRTDRHGVYFTLYTTQQ